MRNIVEEYELAIARQTERIHSFASYSHLFHDVVPNNFSLVSLNRAVNPAKYNQRVKDSLRRLNVANYNLYHFCKLQYREVQWSDEKLQHQVLSTLSKWSNLINAGNSFLCLDCAAFVIQAFLTIDYPLIEKLNETKYKVIIHAFKDIEKWVKSFFKLCVYGNHDFLYERFDDLLNFLMANPEALCAIEKLEIAKEYFPSDKPAGAAVHPVLSLCFDPEEIMHEMNPLLQHTIESISGIFHAETGAGPDKPKYLKMVGSNVSLYQGYHAYKKYLDLIRVLDDLYDAESNYAFLKRN